MTLRKPLATVKVIELRKEEPDSYSAVVLLGDRQERWPISVDDALHIAMEWMDQLAERPDIDPDQTAPAFKVSPVEIELTVPAER